MDGILKDSSFIKAIFSKNLKSVCKYIYCNGNYLKNKYLIHIGIYVCLLLVMI